MGVARELLRALSEGRPLEPGVLVDVMEMYRFALERIAAAPTGFAQAGLLDGLPIYVLGEKAIAPLLADALRLRGVDAHAVDALPAGARGCVYLGGLNAPADRPTRQRRRVCSCANGREWWQAAPWSSQWRNWRSRRQRRWSCP